MWQKPRQDILKEYSKASNQVRLPSYDSLDLRKEGFKSYRMAISQGYSLFFLSIRK